MTDNGAPIRIGDGISQDDRRRTPLDDGWFRVDDLGFEQILSLARDYAGLVRFHPADGSAASPWDGLFSRSEAVVLAEIQSFPVDRLEQGSRRTTPVQDPSPYGQILQDWESRLGQSAQATGIEMRAILKGLRSGLDGTQAPLPHLQAIRIAQAAARRLLPTTLSSGQVEPSTALLIAFAKLYRRLQDKLDRFALDRIDFHLAKILQASTRDGIPDQVHLVAPALPGASVTIPSGTEFVGNAPGAETPSAFSVDAEIRVDDMRVARLLTLHTPYEPGAPGSRRRIAGIWEDSPREGVPSPLFGAARGGGPSATARPARIGFLIADPVLLLREGERRVRITFEYDPETVKESAIGASPETSGAHEILRRFFAEYRDAFRISVTGASGWVEVPEYLPGCALSDKRIPPGSLVIEFALPREAPGIVPFSRETHGPDGDTALPSVRFELRARADAHPLELVSGKSVRQIRIEAEAKGCRDLSLHNQIGPLSPMAPFTPFGPIPSVGSYLVVGCPETQSKTLSRFLLTVTWSDLPRHAEGFAGWYAAYPEPRQTTGFRAVPGYLSEGRWIDVPLPDTGGLPLFQPRVEDGVVKGIASTSSISLRRIIGLRTPRPGREAAEPLTLSPTCQGGYFRLSLSEPGSSFGHQEYPALLARSLMQQARLKDFGKAEDTPNPPYTPTISSISLDYAANATISFDESSGRDGDRHRSRMIHLHPFGWENATRNGARGAYQIPSTGSPGSLFIGLEGSNFRGSIRLLFRIANDSKRLSDPSKAGIRWWYMDRDRWHPIPARDVVSDSTEGLLEEGIVVLAIPAEVSRSNTAMPAGLVWLKATCEDYTDHFGHLLSVHAQALLATRIPADPSRGASLPAGAIRGTRTPIPGLGAVLQPGSSFGGRPPETRSQMRVRMAERLKHKGRAVTASDIEHIVLEAFPEVSKVKCFPHLKCTLPVTSAPGHVLVVPLPQPGDGSDPATELSLDGRLLREIQEHLSSVSGGATRITVANPWYERIQVHCTVRFCHPRAGGDAIRSLDLAIRDWISPWTEGGNTRHFGWCLRRRSLEAFLQDRPEILDIGSLSLLRVSPRPGNLFDIEDLQPVLDGTDELSPRFPWSIPLPLNSHIEVTTDDPRAARSSGAGYGELGIGSTFVIAPGGPA